MPANNTKNILLADASSVTQDITRLALTRRGHRVDIAENGHSAIEMINTNSYDLVLLDFNLVGTTTTEIATQLRSVAANAQVPFIIATTDNPAAVKVADPSDSLFDRIIVKPFRIDEIVPIIESDDAVASKAHDKKTVANESHRYGDDDAPMPLEDLGFNFIYFPRDFYRNARNSVSQMIAENGAPDAVIVTEPPTGDQIELLGRIRGTHSSPLIDLTGRLRHRTDISLHGELPNRDALKLLVEKFQDSRTNLHEDFTRTDNDEELVMVRLYANAEPLQPHYDASIRSAVSYNTIINPAKILTVAPELKRKGLLSGTFFDRYNSCPKCESARIQVREVCTQCQDPQLTEQAYIHHYRCAWQAPVSDFQVGDDLICPKCSYELKHFGKDYDKPGITLICTRFGHHNSEPDVRFICLDCDDEFAAEDAIQRDIESYEITQKGLEFMEAGRAVLGGNRNLEFADLPMKIVLALNKVIDQAGQPSKPFTLATVDYKNLRALEESYSQRDIQQARDMFIALFREELPQAVTASATQNDHLFVENLTKPDLETALANAADKSRRQLAVPLDIAASMFDAHDFASQ